MSQNDALIRFFFKADPDLMDDEKYTEVSGQLYWVLKTTGNMEVTAEGKIRFVK